MPIEKTTIDKFKYYSQLFFLDSARQGEKLLLKYFVKKQEYTLLLPAYIGFSQNEGSGIYDPVIETGIKHKFYKINKDLSIDMNELKILLNQSDETFIVLLVHYFGYPDNNIESIVKLCRDHDAIIIEDAAHALYTDFVDHRCGQFGDYVLYSIHKMLPYKRGGILKINNRKYNIEELNTVSKRNNEISGIFDYDFYKISKKRKNNAEKWEQLISHSKCRKIELVKKYVKDITPQTYPVFIHDYDRTKLYFELNNAGFGAVSLYHTMIEPIKDRYSDAMWVSKHIINLPVHQDVDEDQIEDMFNKMMQILG